MPPDPVWHFYLAGAIAVLAIAAGILYFVLRRRPAPVVPPVPPDVAALEGLRQLEGDAAEPRVFYTRLVEILRAYIAGRFGVSEPEATASELLTVMFRSAETTSDHQRLLCGLIAESDLVKFAGCAPAPDAPARAISACRRFVRETAPQEVVHAAL
jgi:hypothetical protein